MSSRPAAAAADRDLPARAADTLTLTRVVLAGLVGWLAWRGLLDAAAVALALAWLTDTLDGKVARLGDGRTRFGEWDMAVDVLVGASVLAGLGLAGLVPRWLAAAVLVVVGGLYLALRQPALGMVLQAAGYGAFLWRAFQDRVGTLWVPLATIVLIAILDGRKLVRVVLPEFFRGVAGTLRLRRGSGLGLPEDDRG